MFAVCCKLVHGFGLTDSDAKAAILDVYNPRCVPLWGDGEVDEIERKIDELAHLPEATFTPEEMEEIASIGNNQGCMELKGGNPAHSGEALPDRWLLENLPAPLLRVGPRSLLWWQWIGLGLGAFVGAILGMMLGAVVRKLLGRAAQQTPTEWDDRIVARSRGPLALAFALGRKASG